MSKIFAIIGVGLVAFIGFAALLLVISMLFAWPVMLLWNWVGVAVLGLAKVTFWQAWGILMLCGLLFKSSGVSASTKS
jgi:hypothetical protein